MIRVYGRAGVAAADRVAAALSGYGLDGFTVAWHPGNGPDPAADTVEVSVGDEVDVEKESAIRGLILAALREPSTDPDPVEARLDQLDQLLTQLAQTVSALEALIPRAGGRTLP